MCDRRKQSSITINDFAGPSFNLYFDKSSIIPFYDTVNTVVIYERQIDVQSFHKHFANKIVFHPFTESCGMSK